MLKIKQRLKRLLDRMIYLAKFRRISELAARIGGRIARRLARQPQLRAIARRGGHAFPPLRRFAHRLMRTSPRGSSNYRRRPKLALPLTMGSRLSMDASSSPWREAIDKINLASSPEQQREAMDRLLMEIASKSERNKVI